MQTDSALRDPGTWWAGEVSTHIHLNSRGVEALLKWEDGVQQEVKAASALWTCTRHRHHPSILY